MKNYLLLFQLLWFCSTAIGQDANATSASVAPNNVYKDNSWEAGVHAGHFFTAGNVDFIPGYSAGIHVRRALDYVFSLRFDLMYGSAKGEDAGNTRSFENKWFSGSLQGLVSLNNLKWALGERKTNFYLLLGTGLNTFSVDFQKEGENLGAVKEKMAMHTEIGTGISFRINSQINLGLEHKALFVMGNRADLPDGFRTLTLDDESRGALRDVLHYTSLRINYNFGAGRNKAEPLYWLNPMDEVLVNLTTLNDFKTSMTDEDEDGVVDRLDLDKQSLPGVLVNSKGQTLDSDSDGVPDYLDREPFSNPGSKVDSYGVAIVPDLLDEASKMMDIKLSQFKTELPQPPVSMLTDAAIINLLMPVIYYGVNSSAIGNQDLMRLETVGLMMKNFPSVRIVVTGHSDKAGKELANQNLSYLRAKKVVDWLASKYGISRNRLVLQYKGANESFVEGIADVNRRVQFRVATSEQEMAPPQ